MNFNLKKYLAFVLLLVVTLACSDRKKQDKLFVLLDPEQTGVVFENRIQENGEYNIIDFEYLYNGGGVAVGDINNDGMQDLFFSGNMHPSRLYLNQGNFKFKDITQTAGINTEGKWATGVSMVDINSDGLLDIYVCFSGLYGEAEQRDAGKRANKLYINKGNNSFVEKAEEYGIADNGHSTHANFFDYDLDGDLDLYLLTNVIEGIAPNNLRPKKTDGTAINTDRLYRNDGNNSFTNVSKEAGILNEGYGLGVAINDFNNDGYPDIYVSNDYISNDLLYINNGNGTFSNKISEYIKHQSYSAMGNDAGDINNDGLADLITVDMWPADNKRQKLMSGPANYERFQMELRAGYEPQYMRNMLQLNNGNGTFSEIGQLAGVHATDWSWSALFADFDNDGWKDISITNGFPKDITNRDFVSYRMHEVQKGITTKEEFISKMNEEINKMEGAQVPNYLFRNEGNLQFSDRSAEWGFEKASYSNGAAYADLDNDGDLDLVINNINSPAFIYKNRSELKTKNNFLRVRFIGSAYNKMGLGTKVKLWSKGNLQFAENNIYKGYMSTVENTLHFGLGTAAIADSIEITWPDGKYQLLRGVKANQVITADYQNAVATPAPIKPRQQPLFSEALNTGIDYVHQEEIYADFKTEPLLPQKYSQLGPGIAVGDVDGDGLDDFYVGGAFSHSGYLYIQQSAGKFKGRPLTTKTKYEEETGTLLFDADNDDDLDLYIVSGGNEFEAGSVYYRSRLFRNDGKGNFSEDSLALPTIRSSGSCVIAADYDKDGDLDLFIGGRVIPEKYPLAPQSMILENVNGKLVDATTKVCPSLQTVGMVTSALWTDFDNDQLMDLVVVGEWMPISFFQNIDGKLVNRTEVSGLGQYTGWWNSITGADFDNDGDIDYVAGNLGLNTKYKASEKEPVCLYAKDYNHTGKVIPLLSYYVGGQKTLTHGRDDLIDQVIFMKKKFANYTTYASSGFDNILSSEQLEDALTLVSTYMQSSYIENKGNGKFELTPLPVQAQLGPVFGIIADDFNDDGNDDLLITGNSYSPEVATGRYDALVGLYLMGDGKGNFKPVGVNSSGFFIDGDVKGLAQIACSKNKSLILGARNNDKVKVLSHQSASPITKAGRNDSWAEIVLKDGRRKKQEFYYGSSYLSNSSRILRMNDKIQSTTFHSFSGKQAKDPVQK